MQKRKAIMTACLFLCLCFQVWAQDTAPEGQGSLNNSGQPLVMAGSGIFNYSVPISAPAGVNGIAPALAIHYQSVAQDGNAGWGFSISGISSIMRDSRFPVNFNNDDHFILNGEKLFKDSQGFYHTERESFNRIQLTSDGSWLVTMLSGMKLFFGSTPDSFIKGQGTDQALIWALAKVQDIHGNAYTITYQNKNDQDIIYPQQCIYTLNDAFPPVKYHTINFEYEPNPGTSDSSEGGKSYATQRLINVTVRTGTDVTGAGGVLLRRYALGYEQGAASGKSHLKTIKAFGTDDTTFINIANFDWTDETLLFNHITPAGDQYQQALVADGPGDNDGVNIIPGDFNGDVKVDFIRQEKGTADNDNVNTFQIYFSNGDGTFNVVTPAGDQYQVALAFDGPADNGGVNLIPGDFNGDNKTDFIRQEKGTLDNDNVNTIQLYISNGDGTFQIITPADAFLQQWGGGDGPTDDGGCNLIPGDFNGDAKTDFIRQEKGVWDNDTVNNFQIFFSDGDGTFNVITPADDLFQIFCSGDGPADNAGVNIRTGDFNGDGLGDFLRQEKGIWDNDNITNFGLFFSKGDGTFTYITPAGDQYQVALAGDGPTDDGGCNIFPGDFDGDRRTDLIRQEKGILDDDNVNNFQIYYSNGDGTFNVTTPSGDEFQLGLVADGTTGHAGVNIIVGDFAGTHKDSFIRQEKGTLDDDLVDNFSVFLSTSQKNDLVKTVHLVTGGSMNIEYGYVSPGGTSSSSGDSAAVANTEARLVVTKQTSDDGFGTLSSIEYEYNNPKTFPGEPKDRVNIGFEWVKTKINSPDGGQFVTQTFYQFGNTDDEKKAFAGISWKTEVFNSQGVLTNRTQQDWALLHKPEWPDGVSWPFMTHQTGFIFDKTGVPVISRTDYVSYDTDIGQPTEVRNFGEVGSDGSDLGRDRVDTLAFYAKDPVAGIAAAYKTQKFGYNLAGNFVLAGEKRFLFYADAGDDFANAIAPLGQVGSRLLIARIEYENGDDDTFESLAYTGWGVNDRNRDANGVTVRQVVFDTDYHLLPIQEINAKGQSLHHSYNQFLLPVEEVNLAGVSALYRYDVFGRVIKTILPDDTEAKPTTICEYKVEGTATDPAFIKCLTRTGPDTYLATIDYLDGFTRKIQSKSEKATPGLFTTVDVFYDSMGRGVKSSLPYPSSSIAFNAGNERNDPSHKFATVEFDENSRAFKSTKVDGTVQYRIYGVKFYADVDPLGRVTAQEVDAENGFQYAFEKLNYTGKTYAEMVQSFDTDRLNWTYRIQRTYGTDGTRVAEKTPTSKENVITTKVDLIGRKTELNDPDLGTWHYSYYIDSMLKKQVDADGNVITYTYDPLKRQKEKTVDGILDTVYNYDEPNHGFSTGQLTSVWTRASSMSFVYDRAGRITSTTRTIDGFGSRTLKSQFDESGRLTGEIYPDGEQVGYTYDRERNLKTVKGLSPYVKNIDYSFFNAVTSMTYGNNVTTTYAYDPVTLRLANVNAPGVMNLSYTYDLVGNILTKKDNYNYQNTETYTYDSLNRLKTAKGIFGFENYLYDGFNNLLGKGGVQTRFYPEPGSAKPHAVKKFEGKTYEYDANGNMKTRTEYDYDFDVDCRSFIYDGNNRLVKIKEGFNTVDEFAYDHAGARVLKTEGGKTTLYWFKQYEEEIEGYHTSRIKYYIANGERIAQFKDYTLTFIHNDQIKTTARFSSSYGNLVKASFYAPFGEPVAGTTVGIKSYFSGHEFDISAGIYIVGNRYYDPDLGRFIQPDPFLDGMNRYTYVGNNPINIIDPTGLWGFSFGIGITISYDSDHGFGVGVGVSADISTNGGFGLGIDASYTFYSDGSKTAAVGIHAELDIGLIGISAGVGFSYNTYTGYNLNANIGANIYGLGVEVSTSHYWDKEWNYIGGNVRFRGYLGSRYANTGGGYQVGFGNQKSGWFYDVKVLGFTFGDYGDGFKLQGFSTSVSVKYNVDMSGKGSGFQADASIIKDLKGLAEATNVPFTAAGIIIGLGVIGFGFNGHVDLRTDGIEFISDSNLGWAFSLGYVRIYAFGSSGPSTNIVSPYTSVVINVGKHERNHTMEQWHKYGIGFGFSWLLQGGASPSNTWERDADVHAKP